jgi:hypothetical protein
MPSEDDINNLPTVDQLKEIGDLLQDIENKKHVLDDIPDLDELEETIAALERIAALKKGGGTT